jgi:hypothetical protein
MKTIDRAAATHAHVFLHIQKTIGTSIRHALQTILPQDVFATIYPGLEGIPLGEFEKLPEDVRRRFHLIFGHLYFGVHIYVPRPVKYLTFLRDPIKRLRSNYWQTKSFYYSEHAVPLSDIAMRGLWEEFDNYSTRIISGVSASTVPCGLLTDDILNLALRNIRESFEFVGIVERLERDWPRYLRVLGLDQVPLQNINPTPQTPDADFDCIDWNMVERNNRLDIALYNAVKNMDWPV